MNARWMAPAFLFITASLISTSADAATWLGGSGNYSDSTRWDTGVVPCFENGVPSADATFTTPGDTITMDVPVCGTDEFFLAQEVVFDVSPGTRFDSVQVTLDGILRADASDVFLVDVQLSGGATEIVATNGATVDIEVGTFFADAPRPPGSYAVIDASGAGTLVQLDRTTNIDFSVPPGPGSVSLTMAAGTGATLDLSGVTDIQTPQTASSSALLAVLNDAELRLDSLERVTGTGTVGFFALDSALLTLPSLDLAQGGNFAATNGGQLSVTWPFFRLDWSAMVDPGGVGLVAIGEGALLDLSTLNRLDASFAPVDSGNNFVSISARQGGVVDLSLVNEIIGPLGAEDSLDISVSDPVSAIHLDELRSLVGSGRSSLTASFEGELQLPFVSLIEGFRLVAFQGGRINIVGQDWTWVAPFDANENFVPLVANQFGTRIELLGLGHLDAGFTGLSDDTEDIRFLARAGTRVEMGFVHTITAPASAEDRAVFEVENQATLLLGPLTTLQNPGQVAIELLEAQAQLELPAGITVHPQMAISAVADSDILIGGDLSVLQTEPSAFDLDQARLLVDADTPVTIEAASANEGAQPVAAAGFEYGRWIIGTNQQAAMVELTDAVDNGTGTALCDLTREAIYLLGDGPGADGLTLVNGSTLQLNGIDVYTSISGVMTHLNPLVPTGAPLTFGDGFVEGGATGPDQDGDGIANAVDNCVAADNPMQTDADGDGYGNACDTDLDNNLVVNAVDLGLLRVAFFATPADANWNPAADFNDDGVINVVDLGRMRVAFFEAPGPSCLVP